MDVAFIFWLAITLNTKANLLFLLGVYRKFSLDEKY